MVLCAQTYTVAEERGSSSRGQPGILLRLSPPDGSSRNQSQCCSLSKNLCQICIVNHLPLDWGIPVGRQTATRAHTHTQKKQTGTFMRRLDVYFLLQNLLQMMGSKRNMTVSGLLQSEWFVLPCIKLLLIWAAGFPEYCCFQFLGPHFNHQCKIKVHLTMTLSVYCYDFVNVATLNGPSVSKKTYTRTRIVPECERHYFCTRGRFLFLFAVLNTLKTKKIRKKKLSTPDERRCSRGWDKTQR